jgi:membrane-associated phospholipid phosphatase
MFSNSLPSTEVYRSPAAGWSATAAPGRAQPGRLLVAALGYLLALGLTTLLFVRTRGGQLVDGGLTPHAAYGYVRQTALTGPAARILALAGDPLLLALLLLAVLLVGTLGGRALAAVAGIGVVLCSVTGARVLKLAIVRPDLAVDGWGTHNSFPSGHVAGATGLLLAFMLVLPVGARRWLALPGAVGVSVVAAATMVAGWHRFSDTIGGALLASLLCCLAAAVLSRRPGGSRMAGRPDGLARTAALVALPVGIAATVLLGREPLGIAIVAAGGVVVLSVMSVMSALGRIDFRAAPVDSGPESGSGVASRPRDSARPAASVTRL